MPDISVIGAYMRKIKLNYEPLQILQNQEVECEMTDSQLAFLCGVLKDKRPEKIVEVGVAHGGTTCVILECLKENIVTASLHSVDISAKCYRTHDKKTGYAVDMVFDKLPENITHFWHLGNSLPYYLEEIGGEIDVLILDTVHSMPGEMLDFLAALPYLSSNAIVILHDITLNQISDNEFGYATRIVYDVATGEKIIADGVAPNEILPGIGAFQITEDTLKYVEKCFSALAITWKYDLTDEELEQYRILYNKFYRDDLTTLFNKAVTANRKRMFKENYRKDQADQEIINFHKCVMSEYKLVLFGGGFWAELISQYLHAIGKKVSAYVVSNEIDISTCKIRNNIYHFSDLPYPEQDCCLIMAVDSEKQRSVIRNISENSFQCIFKGEDYIYNRLAAYINDVLILKKAESCMGKR